MLGTRGKRRATESVYGVQINKSEAKHIFGDSVGKGIIHDGTNVKHIFVTFGKASKYDNEITDSTLLYCYSPADPDNDAMRSTFKAGLTFPVKVAADGGTETFFWGNAIIKDLVDPTPRPPGKACRYVIDKVDDNMPIEDCMRETKVQKTGARCVRHLGIEYDSVLEARHAVMMQHLGIWFVRPTPVLLGLEIRKADGSWISKSYNPDFKLQGDVYVEIKPQQPYDVALQLCIAACRKYHCTILCLYHSEFHCPFAKEASAGDAGGDYGHAGGICGEKFSWDDAAQDVVHEANVTYMAEDLEDGTTVATIGPRKGPLDDRVYHPKVLAAYEAARSATFDDV